MTGLQLCYAFVDGKERGTASSLRISGDCLLSYSTCICERKRDKNGKVIGFYVNETKYSRTTTDQQNWVWSALNGRGRKRVVEMTGVPMGTCSLAYHHKWYRK